MSVVVHEVVHEAAPRAAPLVDAQRWRAIPVSIAADLRHIGDQGAGDPGVGQIDPAIRPLRPAGLQPRLFGRAVTARCAPPDFGAVLYAIDQAGPGDVLVIAADGHSETAMIGDILSDQLRRLGAVGVVCDGAVRDVDQLAAWTDFSVYARHIVPRGPSGFSHGVVNAAVAVGGCVVRPGDLILGDDDGLAVLTPAAVLNRIADAEAKLALEAAWRANLAAGRSVAETFDLPKPAAPIEGDAP